MNPRIIGYWVSTALFCLAMGGSGVANLVQAAPLKESIAGLGYPEYLMTILGVAKVLGVVALLAPLGPTLREWAYAGFTFDLLGAAASHGFAGHPVGEMAPPLVLLAIGAASYFLSSRPPASELSVAGASP
ncbi:MAG: DoxX family protein [Planctomycetota bacterium]